MRVDDQGLSLAEIEYSLEKMMQQLLRNRYTVCLIFFQKVIRMDHNKV